MQSTIDSYCLRGRRKVKQVVLGSPDAKRAICKSNRNLFRKPYLKGYLSVKIPFMENFQEEYLPDGRV
jgi:hypothetical protein